ncbi:tetratricopeptide repeat protein [Siphonobacter sp. SORGH_AS_0500]|uniref:tetratricopeptide repeat protein n=1 Tax=Siphonobacter sp. SORGH_AS_0500 TaxID=1864824 RepID=UPI002864E9DD|nr:tetratricopeptide repeat protein [Siphonobacter sp. SORGH_AS_0500]MDR6194028.1 tetratricopeptide (TPR) repeat protein [Siphonobacter sp. SORGH_AS_0500]
MKPFCLFLLFVFTQQVLAQDITTDRLKGVWVAKRVEYRNGYQMMSDTEVDQSNIVFVFEDKRLRFYTNERSTSVSYTLSGNRIRTAQNAIYQIDKLTDFELQLSEQTSSVMRTDQLRFICSRQDASSYDDYIRKKFILPAARFDSDTFYVMNETIFPKFRTRLIDSSFYESYRNSYNFIEDAFRQLARPRRDRFRVSFIVNATGQVENIQIVESSDPKNDANLRKAIKASEGMWIPARISNKPVRTQVNYEFPYGIPENKQLSLDDIKALKAKDLFETGLQHFNRQRYAEALEVFNQCVDLDPGNVSIRFNRAAALFKLNRTQDACKDWKLLEKAGEKEATKWLKKYCQ